MKANSRYFRVGLFVLLAAAVGTAAVAALGAGEYFREKVPFETYVDESVQGLDVGAPVKIRGVQVGNLETIDFVRNRYVTHHHYVYLGMSFFPDRLAGRLGQNLERRIQEEIVHGLRIRLASQGLTGGVYLEIDYLDPVRNPVLPITWRPAGHYVPSAGSTGARLLDRVVKVVTDLDDAGIDEIGKRMTGLLDEATRTVRRVEEFIASIDRASAEASRTVEELRKVVKEDVARRLATLLDTLQAAVEKDLAPAARGVGEAAREVPPLVERVERTLRRIDRVVAEQDRSLDEALDNLRVISEDVRDLTGSLKRYPAQALFGEPPPRAKAVGR